MINLRDCKKGPVNGKPLVALLESMEGVRFMELFVRERKCIFRFFFGAQRILGVEFWDPSRTLARNRDPLS